jgi:OPA family sugar phosphate sensor protein UhpC-like MFS transporter
MLGGSLSVLDVFKPASPIEEIQDPELVKKHYKYWRLRTFYAMWVGYAFFYFTRKSFTFAMPMMQSELGFGKFELGLLGSILYITYGASKFVSGVVGDRSNPRYFMSVGLILTGVFNLLFGLSSFFWAFAIFWGLNGWFQGWGWPGCAKLLTHWYSHSERGRWWSLWNTSHNIGGALIPIVVAACAEYYGWRCAMYVPGIICIAAGFFIMNRLRDTPQSLGLPPIEKFRDDYPNASARKEQSAISAKELLWEYVLTNKFIWLLALGNLLIYIIRTAVNDWSMLYLIEVKNYTNLEAGLCVCWFEIGGFFGSLAAGWASDLLFQGKRTPVNILFTTVILFLLFAFKAVTYPWPLLDGVFMFLFGFFIFGPQMLMGMAAAEMSHKNAAATATGFLGFFGYLGAAAAGGPLGAITKAWGWDSYLLTLFVCGLLGAVALLPLWSIKTNPRVAKRDEAAAG